MFFPERMWQRLRCQDPVLQAKTKKPSKFIIFPKDGEKRCVISCLKLVSLMEEICPEIDVQVVGEDRCAGGMDLCEQTQRLAAVDRGCFCVPDQLSVQPIRSWLTIMM